MSDSTSKFTQLTTAQAGKEATVNELMNSVSPASLFARLQASTGLTWNYMGGRFLLDGVSTVIANSSIALTASATNYIECTRAGVVSKNTTAFTPGSIPLYKIVASTATVSSYEDHRPWVKPSTGRKVRSITSDANITLTFEEAVCEILEFTSTVSLTVTRNVTLPLAAKEYVVFNNTTGGKALQFIGATGTGVTVANGQRAIIYADGTNVVPVLVEDGRLVKDFATDANITLTTAEAANKILEFTSSVSLTVTRDAVLPLDVREYTVFNNTTGAQSIQFIGATGTGVTVANGTRAKIYADGTNIVRITPDT